MKKEIKSKKEYHENMVAIYNLMNKGYLYILFNESYKHYGDSTYKFGRTQNLRNRIFTYNTSFVHDSKYLHTSREFKDCIEAERVLFFLMKEYRIKNNKEFFKIFLA